MNTIDNGNNETLSRGIIKENDETFTVLGFSFSKNFKTIKGATKYAVKMGV